MKVEFDMVEASIIESALRRQDELGYLPFKNIKVRNVFQLINFGKYKGNERVVLDFKFKELKFIHYAIEKYAKYILDEKSKDMSAEEMDIVNTTFNYVMEKIVYCCTKSEMQKKYNDSQIQKIRNNLINKGYGR